MKLIILIVMVLMLTGCTFEFYIEEVPIENVNVGVPGGEGEDG